MTAPRRLEREEIAAAKRAIAIAEGSTTEPQSPSASTAHPLRNWLEDPEMLRAPEIVLPHLVVEGRVSLLSGREKIGKSTLAAGAVSAGSRGDDVLGVPLLDSVRTLWYALDEPVADTVRRFQKLGADIDRIAINDQPRTVTDLIEALESDFARYPSLDACVVDTLSRVIAMSGVDPNSSREVEPVIAQLADFFHRENKGCLLLYHTGKRGREYRGSTAIGATVDDVLTLRRRGEGEEDDFDDDTSDDGRRLLVQEGRNLRGRIHLTCADGVYRIYEEANPPRTRILNTLRDHGTVRGRAELTKLAGVRKEDGLHEIANLILEGAILESGRNLKPSVTGIREPASKPLLFPSSATFPDTGTTGEPVAEPVVRAPSLLGSGSGEEGVTEGGTDYHPRRLIQRDGLEVAQVRRSTARGTRWIDEERT